MSAETPNQYDLVPYESHPFPQTHPSRLFTVGTLFGMRPAPIHKCRLLELGCASGGNLIPMAVQMPESQFVGVDLSLKQIEEGNKTIAALGLRNIELRNISITQVDSTFGKFDYLISHGVFSWVATDVQEAMFRIAAERLHPQGIAYLSYNTYPGWHMRGLIREMMRYHAANFSTPKIRTRQARGLLDFLASSVPQDGSAFSTLLKQEVETLRHHADYYLFHEHLEEVNSPLFFHQFVERASQHRLQYLAEANVRSMMLTSLPEDIQKALRMMATDQIQLEQYMDFLRNRTFRETLICHGSVPLSRALDGDPVRRLWVASRAEPVGPASRAGPGGTHERAVAQPSEPLGPPRLGGPTVNIQTDEPVAYRSPGGYTLTTSLPLMKAAFTCLREVWPQAMAFETLAKRLEERLAKGEPDRALLASRLVQTYLGSDLIELVAGPLPFVTAISEQPVACPYARSQALQGEKATTRRHAIVGLNPLQRALLPLLDGTKNRTQLLQKLTEMAEKDRLSIRHGNDEIEKPEEVEAILTQSLGASLEDLAKAALLIG